MIRPDDKDKTNGKVGSGAPSTQPIVSEASDGVDAWSGASVTQPSREFAEAISRRTDRNMSPPRDTPESQQEVVAAARPAGSKGGEATKGSAHSSGGSAPTVQPSRKFAEAIRKRTVPVNFPQEELETEERETGDNASVMPVGGRHAPGALDPEGEERLRQQEAQELADAVKGTDDNINLLQKWLDEHPRLTKEQRERLARREKSRRLMASVGDGLSALGSLFFTTQYSPELFDARRGHAAQVDARQEKLRAQREREADRYMNFALRLGDLKNGRAGIAREVAAMQQKRRRENEEDKRRREREPYVLAAAQEEARRKKAQADRARVQADKEGDLINSIIGKNKSQEKKNLRPPTAGKGGGSGRGSKPGPTLFVHDKAHYPGGSYLEFGNTTEYNKAVMAWASYYDVPTTTTSPRGTTVSRGIPTIAAEVEAKAREAAEGQGGSHPRQSPRVIAGGPGRGAAINGARQTGASGSNGKKPTRVKWK